MGRCVEEWMDGFNRWMCVWINVGNTDKDGWRSGYVDRSVADEWVCWLVGEWVNGCMDAWINMWVGE